MCVYNPVRALCHRPDTTGAPSLDQCRPECANIARTDQHVAQLLDRAASMEMQAASGTVPGPLAERLTRRAGQLREAASRHEHERVHHQEMPV